jgi:hypothetical protein
VKDNVQQRACIYEIKLVEAAVRRYGQEVTDRRIDGSGMYTAGDKQKV